MGKCAARVLKRSGWCHMLTRIPLDHGSECIRKGQSDYQCYYTVSQKYAHIGLNQNLFRSTTLDIITRLLDNAAFVCVYVVGRLSKDFSEVRELRSRGFQL